MSKHDDILEQVSSYYTAKLREFGSEPRGADWNSLESQSTRFAQLVQDLKLEEGTSLLDYGCGYGALFEFLTHEHADKFHYTGYDISEEMIDAAQEQFSKLTNSTWQTTLTSEDQYDYVLASGVLNVKQDIASSEWEQYIWDTLDDMWSHTRMAMSFNILSTHSDIEYRKDSLYYADPETMLEQCTHRFSPHVSISQDYGLYEFTVSIRKDLNE